jgi:excisionase family DNA binding protein
MLNDVSTLEEAAAYLRIAPQTLRRMTLGPTPKIGFLKQGRTLTFPRAALEQYVEDNTRAATPPNPFGLTDASLRRVRRSS